MVERLTLNAVENLNFPVKQGCCNRAAIWIKPLAENGLVGNLGGYLMLEVTESESGYSLAFKGLSGLLSPSWKVILECLLKGFFLLIVVMRTSSDLKNLTII